MKKVFLHSAVSISAQNTFEGDGFLEHIIDLPKKTALAQYPEYRDYISPVAARRMATGVKMGVTAAYKALKNANLEQPDAIITGTGMGCIEDTEKFLNTIITNDEEFLTPTAFIQSTHNTVGAQIALGLKCKAYNNTYVHASLSFESALLDAQLMLQQEEAQHILVGGVDELGNEIINYVRMMEDVGDAGINVPFGEGASFFVVSSKEKENTVEVVDMEVCSLAPKEIVLENLKVFLERNALESAAIDLVVLGRNGDVYDTYYDEIGKSLETSTEINYKHLSGEFYTASSFGLWAAFEMLNRQEVPRSLLKKNKPKPPLKYALLYNQFKGRDHSFILLKRC